MGSPMRLPRVMRCESLKSQNDVDRDSASLCVSNSELELHSREGWERYGKMSVLENRTGSSASMENADSNSSVNRDDTGDGIMDRDIQGDLVKLESGDRMDPVPASEMEPLNDDVDGDAMLASDLGIMILL